MSDLDYADTLAPPGTDVMGYLTESQGFSAFVLDDGPPTTRIRPGLAESNS